MTITHITEREQALTRENERLLNTIRVQAGAIEVMQDDLEKYRALMLQHLAEIAPLRADAARYRWLFKGAKCCTQFMHVYLMWDGCGGKHAFDAVIDNEIKESKS